MHEYEQALAMKNDFIPAMDQLMILYSDSGRNDKVLDILKRMKSLQPGNPNVYYNFARVHAWMNQPDVAVRFLEQALGKGFTDLSLLENDRDLAAVRAMPSYRTLMARFHQSGSSMGGLQGKPGGPD